ncbi:hypothetical protein ACHAQJ_009967 [Trichoderma viride]
MSSEQKPLYSQGLNFGSFIQDGVDTRTGQYTCSIALYEAPVEARNCPPFQLALSYNPLNSHNVGPGPGWSFNLSSYKHRQLLPTLYLSTGEQYQVRQIGDKFDVKDKKLESFEFKTMDNDDYQIIHKSGLIEILSNVDNTYDTTVPVELRAANGQSLTLNWTCVEGSTPQLTEVKHGSDVLLEIQYLGNQVLVIRAPNTADASTSTLFQQSGQLIQLVPPLGDSQQPWWFDYTTYDQITCLTRISNPAGLVKEVKYDPEGHRLPDGAPLTTVQRVSTYTVQPGDNQPDIVTYYEYSHHNFFGYEGILNWEDGKDNLYRVPNHYHYTTTATVGVNGPKTTYTYNKFHLLTENKREQGSTLVKQAIEYNASPTLPFELQPKKFQLPKTTTTAYEDHGGSHTPRIETTEHDYDDWGNPISETQKNGVKTKRVYYPPIGEKGLCPADPHRFSRYIKTETVLPSKREGLLPAPTQTKHYKYLRLPTATGTGYYVAVEELQIREKNQILSTTSYGYYIDGSESRDHGRLQKQATSLSDQSPTQQEWSYNYPKTNDKVTKITRVTTFDKKHTTHQEVTYSLLSGHILAQVNTEGVKDSFQYDKMDRLVQATASPRTPYEATRRYDYAVADSGIGYCLVVTNDKGVKTRHTTDGLERVRLVERQDDSGQENTGNNYDGTFRTIEERAYNELGQCDEVYYIDWSNRGSTEYCRKEGMIYDDWGQVCRTTKASGKETLTTFLSITNPVDLTWTEGIEGEGQTKTWSNLFGTADRVELQKKDEGGKYKLYSKLIYVYDGLGRLAKETDHFGHTKQYQVDSYGRVIQTIWPDARVVKTQYAVQTTAVLPVSISVKEQVMGEQSVDGLSRILSQTVGGRNTLQTYDGNGPNPSEITTPCGNIHRLTYKAALGNRLSILDSPDETSTYEYDNQSASLLQLSNSYSTEDGKYLRSGLLKHATIKTSDTQMLSTESTYSMAGKVLSYTNVHGEKQTYAYDGFGRLRELTQGGVKATIEYDKSNRPYTSCVLDEATQRSVTTLREYDDFGREIVRTVSQGTETMYRLTQTFNETSLVTGRLTEDGKSTVIRDEAFAYDNCNRLFSYKCKGTRPPLDEKGHAIKEQHFVFDSYDNIVEESTTFQDSSENTRCYIHSKEDPTQLVQITNKDHPEYPAKIELSYDKNGCLVKDEQGRILKYDSRNLLRSVSDGKNNRILSEYRYDAAGRLVCQEVEGKHTYFYYRGDALIAMTKDNTKVSLISDTNGYWGQTSQEGNNTKVQLWASDTHESVLGWVDTQSTNIHHQQYTPYGFSTGESTISFNGQYRDPITGWYHLGNGYRVYNPVLMRFHTPESQSPFTTGEINPYAFCQGDPINRTDPTGHMSGRDWTVMGVGLFVGILVGIFTAGAGFAVAVGVSIAAGLTSDVVTGLIYDSASGKGPSWGSVGMDALFGAFGGLIGEGVGRGLASGFKAASRGLARLSSTVDQLLEGAERLRMAGGPRALPAVTAGSSQAVDIEVLSVREIFYSQDSIGANFRNGGSIRDTVQELRGLNNEERLQAIGNFPKLNVVKFDIRTYSNGIATDLEPRWISVDNRRLRVFKAALEGSEDDRISVQVLRTGDAIEHLHERGKLTTLNIGESIEIRGGGW